MSIRTLIILLAVSGVIILIGAWQKILHHPMADTLLGVGLVTELAAFGLVIYKLARRN